MNDVVDFIKITPPQMRLRPKGKPIVWDQIPPYERDEDGKLLLGEDGKATYELDFHSVKMIEDPDVAGGYYCTISVVNGISKDGLILPATFSVVPGKEGPDNEEYPGWSIKQGKRTITDGVSSYFVDGKTATLLIGADVDGDCTIYATDEENSISLKASVPIAEWFVLHTPRNPAPPGAILPYAPRERYKLKEIGTGEIRLIADAHYLDKPEDLVDFVKLRVGAAYAESHSETIGPLDFHGMPNWQPTAVVSSSKTETTTTWVEYTPDGGITWIRHPDFPELVFTTTSKSARTCSIEGYWIVEVIYPDIWVWDQCGRWKGYPSESTVTSSGSYYTCTGNLPTSADNIVDGYSIVHAITFDQSTYGYYPGDSSFTGGKGSIETWSGSKTYVEASRIIDAEGYPAITYPETLSYSDYGPHGLVLSYAVITGYIIMWMEYKDDNTYCLKCADTPAESIWQRYATLITFRGKNNRKEFNYPIWVTTKDFSYYDPTTIYYGKETGIAP
jgi:hypothetical protein